MFPWFDNVFKQLSARVATKKLHHAMLIQGPAGIGENQFVLELAHLILCSNPQQGNVCGVCQSCRLNDSATHPDLHLVESDKQIGVDVIRESIKKLVGSAQMSGAKVLIIYQADTMTEASANALLKTLEEPTDSTYLLLTTNKPERILPTIKSRCEKLNLPTPNLDTTLNWVASQYSGEIDRHFAKLFAARPLTLLDELQEEQKLSFDLFNQGIIDLQSGSKSASQLATSWQEYSDKVVKWSQYWLKEQFALTQNTELACLFEIDQKAKTISAQLRNPGVNKVLQLSVLLSAIASFEKH